MIPVQFFGLTVLLLLASAVQSSASPNKRAQDHREDDHDGHDAISGKSDHYLGSESSKSSQRDENAKVGGGKTGIFPDSIYQEVLDSARQRTLNTLNGRLDSSGIFHPRNEVATVTPSGSSVYSSILSHPNSESSNYYRPLYFQQRQVQPTPSSSNAVEPPLPTQRGSLQIGESLASSSQVEAAGHRDGNSLGYGQGSQAFAGQPQFQFAPSPQQFPGYGYAGPTPGYSFPGGSGPGGYPVQGGYVSAPRASPPPFARYGPSPQTAQYGGQQQYLSAASANPEVGPGQRVIMIAVPAGQGYGPEGYAGAYGQGSPVGYGEPVPYGMASGYAPARHGPPAYGPQSHGPQSHGHHSHGHHSQPKYCVLPKYLNE